MIIESYVLYALVVNMTQFYCAIILSFIYILQNLAEMGLTCHKSISLLLSVMSTQKILTELSTVMSNLQNQLMMNVMKPRYLLLRVMAVSSY